MTERLIVEQLMIASAVSAHVFVAGLMAVVLDKLFPKFEAQKTLGRLVLEIAIQISLGAIMITKLRSFSSFHLAPALVALVPFTVVESVVMISPQPELRAKVNQVQTTVKRFLSSLGI